MSDTYRGQGGENLEIDAGEPTSQTPASLANTPLRRYETPHLRYLGSVRELTLGSGTNLLDADDATFHD